MPTLQELAQLVEGQLSGNGQLEIGGAATLRDAQPGDISFASHAGLLPQLARSRASAVILPEGLETDALPSIVVADPEQAFARIVKAFRPAVQRQPIGISPQAQVHPSAKIAADVNVYPGAVIYEGVSIGRGTTIHANVTIMEGSQIGEGTIIFPGAVLYENTIVGDRCIINGGAVLGGYGFGYRMVDGRHRLSVQLGNVVLENDVDIGANTTVDRSTYGSTVIGEGTKIDNQVMIGHNCRIGRHNLLCSQVGIAGSCSTGDYVVMAGQVGIGDHLDIGSQVVIGAQSGVMHHIEDGQRVLGSPAVPVKKQMQIYAIQSKLPELRKQLQQLVRSAEQGERSDSSRNAA